MADLERLFQEAQGQNQDVVRDDTPRQTGGAIDLDAIFNETMTNQQAGRLTENVRQGSIAQMIQESTSLPSPTTFMQDLILSFAPNDQTRIDFLTDQFQGANIEMDPERGIIINGAPINPKGFDKRDLVRFTGDIFPFMGQVLGSLGGLALGSATGPGALATAAAGGVGGAVLGEGLKLAVGDLLGLDVDGQEVFDALAEEAKFAAAGEVLGLGLVGGGKVTGIGLKKLGRTRALKGMANLWRKSMEKVGGAAPVLAQFGGGINPNATRMAQKHGFARTLTEEFFDPDKSGKIVKNTIFGNPNADVLDLDKLLSGGSVQKGWRSIAASIKGVDDAVYDDFMRGATNISQDTIETIKTTPLNEMFSPANLSDTKPYQIAQDVLSGIEKQVDVLGNAVIQSENRAIREATTNFRISDVGETVERMTRSLRVTKGITQKGFEKQAPLRIPGADKLDDLRNLFGARKIIKDRAGREIRREFSFFRPVSMRQGQIIRKRLDVLADTVFKNKSIPGDVKNVFRVAAQEFRDKYHRKLGIEGQTAAFRELKGVLSDTRIAGRTNSLSALENQIRRFTVGKGEAGRANLLRTFDLLDNGDDILRNVRLVNAVDEMNIARADIKKIAANFESKLTSPKILDLGSNNIPENVLRATDNAFKTSPNVALRARAFLDDAERALAASGFKGGSPNVLRVSAIASMVGVGGLLNKIPGALGTLPLALVATNPRNIAKFLVALDRGAGTAVLRKLANKAIGTVGKKQQATAKALLNRLIQQNAQDKQRRLNAGNQIREEGSPIRR